MEKLIEKGQKEQPKRDLVHAEAALRENKELFNPLTFEEKLPAAFEGRVLSSLGGDSLKTVNREELQSEIESYSPNLKNCIFYALGSEYKKDIQQVIRDVLEKQPESLEVKETKIEKGDDGGVIIFTKFEIGFGNEKKELCSRKQ